MRNKPKTKSWPLPTYNHRAIKSDLLDAISDTAVYYAEQVRKRTDSYDEAVYAIENDERPGGLPTDLDCEQMRKAMRRLIKVAYT